MSGPKGSKSKVRKLTGKELEIKGVVGQEGTKVGHRPYFGRPPSYGLGVCQRVEGRVVLR